jgi:hypothetical protein
MNVLAIAAFVYTWTCLIYKLFVCACINMLAMAAFVCTWICLLYKLLCVLYQLVLHIHECACYSSFCVYVNAFWYSSLQVGIYAYFVYKHVCIYSLYQYTWICTCMFHMHVCMYDLCVYMIFMTVCPYVCTMCRFISHVVSLLAYMSWCLCSWSACTHACITTLGITILPWNKTWNYSQTQPQQPTLSKSWLIFSMWL